MGSNTFQPEVIGNKDPFGTLTLIPPCLVENRNRTHHPKTVFPNDFVEEFNMYLDSHWLMHLTVKKRALKP